MSLRPVIEALCEAYIRKALFHCKSEQPDSLKFLPGYSDRSVSRRF
jgi:hypothetical protein